MSQTNPIRRIGIALAAYKPDPKTFAEQLASIQAQSFKDWVCVITCDSPVNEITAHPLISPFKQDSRFQWKENPTRLGHKKNFERAIQAALQEGVDAIACSDQDDIWYPEKIAVCVSELEKKPPLSLVHCDMHVEEDGKKKSQTAWVIESRGIQNCLPQHLLIRNIVAGCSMVFDAELARRFPVIPEDAEYHDHWYALIASCLGGIYAIAQPLYLYRQHGGNQVGVSPFIGRFGLRTQMGPIAILKKCQGGWLRSYRLAKAARDAGVPLPRFCDRVFIQKLDLGLGILALGLSQYWRDPPLARACIARAAGKFVDCVPYFFQGGEAR